MVRAATSSAVSGSGLVEVGNYHGVVDTCKVVESLPDRDGNKMTGLELEVSILAGSVEGQAGKSLNYQKFYGAKLYDLAAALMLTDRTTGKPFDRAQRDKLRAHIMAGTPVIDEYDFDETQVEGRQFCFNVVMGKPKTQGKNEGKSFPEIGRTILGVFDPEAKDIPKDTRYFESGDEGPANGTGSSKFD